MAYALVTGASSGIGREYARILSEKYHYDLIIVARREERLIALKNELNTEVVVIPLDLNQEENCYQLFEMTKDYDVELVINNAGFGDCNAFIEGDLDKELQMINVNIKALHILTKLYLHYFCTQDKGHIINIGSAAGYMEGPYMATYYASKNYVRVLTNSIALELKKARSKVRISLVCPGPIDTEFEQTANVEFTGPLNDKLLTPGAHKVAEYSLKKAFKGKKIIIPGMKIKSGLVFKKIIPDSWSRQFVSSYQKRR